jgi:3-oxoacyl-[acyl-carrier protein] reductase
LSPEKHRCALVTGGSRGIGRAVALRLAADGFSIGFCYRSRSQDAEETAAAIRDCRVPVFYDRCDVTDLTAVTTFVKNVEAELGDIAVLVNSAGILRDTSMVLMSARDWSDVIDTNLTGTFNVCRAAIFGLMKRGKGVIINISSAAGVHGNAGQTNYSASKAGVIGMSRALAKEVAPHNVRVNVIAPGFIETEMTASMTQRARDKAVRMVALRRFGNVSAVAETVSFLASERADYITGQTIQVDGGLTL